MLDYIRIGCAVPPVQVGDVKKNVEDICRFAVQANEKQVDVLVFPEMAFTGYTCADLFFQDSLLASCKEGLRKVVENSRSYPQLTLVVGLPFVIGGQMYNCGAVISNGRCHGVVPKTFLPNYNEFYERRWFSSSEDLQQTQVDAAELGLEEHYPVSVGRGVLFRLGDGSVLGVEICEDLWTPVPPSVFQTLNGAEVVVNLSASNETVGKRSYRRRLVEHQSSLCSCIYAYVSAGCTESTQDLVFSGHGIIAEDGSVLAENQKVLDTDYLLVCDADLGKIRAARRKNKSVKDATSFYGKMESMRTVDCHCAPLRSDGTLYNLEKLPFVPPYKADRQERCEAIFQIQVAGLAHRLKHIGAKAVIGVSGGLDSTLALLVCVEAMRVLGRPASDVYGLTLPCFGTSDRTYRNSWELMRTLGVTAKEISIKNAVTQHFADIGHDPTVFNGTYENAQARERTQILMDYASIVGGIVVGTGDLSELALGWCTYNGDQMSMYGVNASIPKTLMRWMIQAISENEKFSASKAVLEDILDTPISPELLPPDEKGNIAQYTEDLVGPYALHDFFLYYMMRYGFSPTKIYHLACRAFADDFTPDVIKKWLRSFYWRFFSQQFKRSSMPDGVKVGNISLSPRGDWRMPSDASSRIWLAEIDKL